jgi:ABC-2 type transport system permease protein
MLQRILNFFKLDITLSTRDSVLIYSLVSPLMLAIIVRVMVPSVQASTFTMALHDEIPPTVIERLSAFGDVETYGSPAEVIDRVNDNDAVPGVYLEGGDYVLVLEGNEEASAEEGFTALLADATGQIDAEFTITDLQGQPAPILEYGAVMIILLGLFVGGILVGFNIVDEKETDVIKAMAVTPLRILEYIFARSILAVVIAYATGYGAAYIILGAAVPAGQLAFAIAASLFVALPFGFIIGSLADNQMTAFALVKLLMAVFLTLPFVTIFVPAHLQWLFFIFPNYWMFVAMSNVFVGPGVVGFGLSLILTVVTGLALIGLLFPRMRKGISLR